MNTTWHPAFGASCPPDTTPDQGSLQCVPYPGARNINYECGGLLAPITSPGCTIPIPEGSAYGVSIPPAVAAVPVARGWACGCGAEAGTPAQDGGEAGPEWSFCAGVIVLAGLAAMALGLGGKR